MVKTSELIGICIPICSRIPTSIYIGWMTITHIYIYLAGGLEHFLFSTIWDNPNPIDFHIFQRDRLNHQPDIYIYIFHRQIPSFHIFSPWHASDTSFSGRPLLFN